MRRGDSRSWVLVFMLILPALTPNAASARKEPPCPDLEVQKRALVAAMTLVPFDRATGDELLVEYKTHSTRTDIKVSLRRRRKRIGRPLWIRVEGTGKAKIRQHGWAARPSTRGAQVLVRKLGLAGFRALLPHLDLDGDFRLDFIMNTAIQRGEGLFAMALSPSIHRLGHHPHARPLMMEVHADGSTRLQAFAPLWLMRKVAPVGI